MRSRVACLDAQDCYAWKDPRDDIALARRIEKESVEACDRRILEFPLTMSARDAAKALKAGWHSKGTTVYYIEYRVSEGALDLWREYHVITRQ